jgi:hypothetical protein
MDTAAVSAQASRLDSKHWACAQRPRRRSECRFARRSGSLTLLSVGSLRSPDRQLNVNLEVLCSVREGSANPGFKTRMIVGHVSATREPRAIEPLQRAKFQIELAAYLDLRHDHRREPEPANFALWGESLCLDCDVVSAVLQRRDLGVVPLVAKPLPVCELLAFGPRHEALGSPDHGIALVWPGNADVCHVPR